MKIKKEHYAYLSKEINKVFKQYPQVTVARYVERGLTARRWRWDVLLNISGITPWVVENLYPYMNDNHLDSVLRKITGTQ